MPSMLPARKRTRGGSISPRHVVQEHDVEIGVEHTVHKQTLRGPPYLMWMEMERSGACIREQHAAPNQRHVHLASMRQRRGVDALVAVNTHDIRRAAFERQDVHAHKAHTWSWARGLGVWAREPWRCVCILDMRYTHGSMAVADWRWQW